MEFVENNICHSNIKPLIDHNDDDDGDDNNDVDDEGQTSSWVFNGFPWFNKDKRSDPTCSKTLQKDLQAPLLW